MKRKITVIFLLLTILRLSLFIFQNNHYFLRKFDPAYISKLYSESQYVIGERSKGGIGDDGLYAFAGYYYLFQGGDVSKVNFEHPPLGKYLIGVSEFVFGNENIINLIYFMALLFFVYKISLLLAKDRLLAVISVFILSLDNLFLDNLLRSLLDLPFTLFFTGAVYFFLKGMEKSKYYSLSNLFWGFAFSMRFFPSLLILYPFMFLVLFCYKRKNIPIFLTTSMLIPMVYLVSHLSFFVYHPSMVEFLRHKKWMLSWFSGSVVAIGNIWRNIYTGIYLDSRGKLALNEHWMILVPVVVTMGITRVRKNIFQTKNPGTLFVWGLSIIFLLYVTFMTGGVQKFIMPVYPLLVILAVHNANLLYSIIRAWMKDISSPSKTKS